jgi:hypothetical protein
VRGDDFNVDALSRYAWHDQRFSISSEFQRNLDKRSDEAIIGWYECDLAGGRRSSGEGEEAPVRFTGGGRSRVFSNANKVCSISLSWAGPREVPRSVGHSGAHNVFHFAKGLGHLFLAHGRRAVRIPRFASQCPSRVSLLVASEGSRDGNTQGRVRVKHLPARWHTRLSLLYPYPPNVTGKNPYPYPYP